MVKRRIKSTWLLAAVSILLVGFLAYALIRTRFRLWQTASYDVPTAIHDTADIVNFLHTYRSKNGEWPLPGSIEGRNASFLRSEMENGVRVDIYRFREQEARLYLYDDHIQTLASYVPTTQPGTTGM